MTYKTDTMPLVAAPVDAAWAVFRDFEGQGIVYITSLTAGAVVEVASGPTYDPNVLNTALTLTFPQVGVTQAIALPVSTVSASVTGSIDLTTLTYGGGGTVDGKSLSISLDGASPVSVTFAAPASASAVATQINTAVGPGVASVVSNHLVITSKTTGINSSVAITGGTAAPLLGLPIAVVKAFAASPLNRANRVKPTTGRVSVTWTGPSTFTTFMSAPYQTTFAQ